MKARLVSERSMLTPGQTASLGISFEIDDGWHVYWDGASDTGTPIRVSFTAPAGFKVGPILWPAPKRLASAGDILDYIYEKRVTLIVPVEVPADAAVRFADKPIPFHAALNWVVCKDVCKFGKSEVSASLPLGESGAVGQPGKDGALFVEARARIPKDLSSDQRLVRTHWEGDRLLIEAPGAAGLLFYPGNECATMVSPIEQGESRTGRLGIDFKPDAGKVGTVTGVLEVRHPEGKATEFYRLTLAGGEGNPKQSR